MTVLAQDEASLNSLRSKRAALRGNLYNQGLMLPGCEIAYTAALQCGATPFTAWEAARQHVLLELNPDVSPDVQTQARYASGALDHEYRRQEARREAIARIRALPNPFAVSSPRLEEAA